VSGKLIELSEAAALIPDGATISFGGFTTQRHPMAFVYELIRAAGGTCTFSGTRQGETGTSSSGPAG